MGSVDASQQPPRNGRWDVLSGGEARRRVRRRVGGVRCGGVRSVH